MQRIEQPGDRFIVRLGDGASLEEAVARVNRVLGSRFLRGGEARGAFDGSALPRCLGRSRAARIFKFCGAGQAQRQIVSAHFHGDRFDDRPLPAREAARTGPQSERETQRPGTHLLRRNHAGPCAGLCATNSRHRRTSREYSRANDVPALRRVRFGGGCVPHDEARRPPELRAFLWHGRKAGRIVRARRERAGAPSRPVSISRQALPDSVRSDSTRNRPLRSGKLSSAALPADDAADCGTCSQGAIARWL